MARKVLVVAHALMGQSSVAAVTLPAIKFARDTARAYGYEVDVIGIGDGSTYLSGLTADDYEFAIVPILYDSALWSSSTPWRTAMNGTLPFPTFILGILGDSPAWIVSLIGCDTSTAAGYNKYSWGGTTVYKYGRHRKVNASHTSSVSFIVTLASDATYATCWKKVGASTTIYCSAEQGQDAQWASFPIMLQTAINDGLLNPPPKKATSCFDIDNFPDTNNTLADMQGVYAMQQAYNMPITYGLKTDTTTEQSGVGGNNFWNSISSTLKDYIAARTPDKGGLIRVCSHNHNWNWDGTAAAPLNLSGKSNIDLQYRFDVAKITAAGITAGENANGLDGWGYILAPTNYWDDTALQLLSPQTTLLSSPGNDTIQAGYGVKAIRVDTNSRSKYLYSPSNTALAGGKRTRTRTYKRGIRLLPSSSLLTTSDVNFTVDSATEITAFAKFMCVWMSDQMVYDVVQYLHSENFYDGHHGGNTPGLTILTAIGAVAAKLPDVHRFTYPGDLT